MPSTRLQIIREQPRRSPIFNPDVPTTCKGLCVACLAKDPEERYQTIKDVAIEIKRPAASYKAAPVSIPQSNTIDCRFDHSQKSSMLLISLPRTAAFTNSFFKRIPSSVEYIFDGINRHSCRFGRGRVAGARAGGQRLWPLQMVAKQSKPVPAFQSAKLQRLDDFGQAPDAAISPDGKYVAHVKSDAGQRSLWLRQVATTSDTQIVAPSWQNYYGITFSKDGDLHLLRLRRAQ